MALPEILSGRQPRGPYVVSFEDIVEAHLKVDQLNGSRGDSSPDGPQQQQEERLEALWEKFASQEGEVISSFFGGSGNTGAALTIRYEQRAFIPVFWRRPRLHVALDLATAGEAADLVSRYERLRVKADQLLRGDEREHVTRVLYDRLCRVICIVDQMLALDRFRADPHLERISEAFQGGASSAVFLDDRPASNEEKSPTTRRGARRSVTSEVGKRIANALTVAKAEVAQAENLCNRAVHRGAMMAYFVGMLMGIVVFTGLGIGLSFALSSAHQPGFSTYNFLTVFIGGAVGAIVSVMSRMSAGDSWLEDETARSYLRLLGMFRPLIGAIFGVALYFGIQSGVLQFIKPPNSNAVFFFFAFIAFLAGFSERWASDVLVPIKERSPPRTDPKGD